MKYSKMTMKTHQYRLVEELRREREAIDEVIAAYEEFCEKLSQLPPEVVRRVSRLIEQSHTEESKANFERVAEFLRTRGNVPQSARAIQSETMMSRGALAFVLYTSHRHKFEKHEDPLHSRKKLWSLKAPTDEVLVRETGEVFVRHTSTCLNNRRLVTLHSVKADLVGRTSFECAKQILLDHGNQQMHFGTVAKEAIARGYTGKPSNEPLEQEAMEYRIAQSFWAMMHRAPETFEKIGRGYFRLTLAAATDANKQLSTGENDANPTETGQVQQEGHQQSSGLPLW